MRIKFQVFKVYENLEYIITSEFVLYNSIQVNNNPTRKVRFERVIKK